MADVIDEDSSRHTHVERVDHDERVLADLLRCQLRWDHYSVDIQLVDGARDSLALATQHEYDVLIAT